MKLLLDTHTLLWFIAGSADLSSKARALIEDAENEKSVSIASIWEIAIKISIGKISLTTPFDSLFPHQLDFNGFHLAHASVAHASIVAGLPFHHRDPFDRLLVAQAMHDGMHLVSIDDAFDNYGVKRLW